MRDSVRAYEGATRVRCHQGALTVLASQIETVLSAEQVETELEKGMNLTELTESAWPLRVTRDCPLQAGTVGKVADRCPSR